MAYKTMLRQLISKWGVMSIDMQMAFESDMAVIHEDGTKDYVDNDNIIDDVPAEVIEDDKPIDMPEPIEEVKPTEKTANTEENAQQVLFS